MKNKKSTTLYCFSPPVMIATIVVELVLALFTFIKVKKSALKNIALATLMLLAFFQAAEFAVCQSLNGIDGLFVSRIGFVAITLLPPLGIHTINIIAGRRRNWSTFAAYILAGSFIVYFLVAPSSINDSICSGNYVIFRLAQTASLAYGAYYFTLLCCIIALSVYLAIIQKNAKKRRALWWMLVGSLGFLVPTGVAYFVFPDTSNGIPSIMCGFAVIYAVVLSLRVVPLASSQK
jgi:hypothetical protein